MASVVLPASAVVPVVTFPGWRLHWWRLHWSRLHWWRLHWWRLHWWNVIHRLRETHVHHLRRRLRGRHLQNGLPIAALLQKSRAQNSFSHRPHEIIVHRV